MERRKETAAVKNVLTSLGYSKQAVSVKHGTGTAWGWLSIRVPLSAKATGWYDGLARQRILKEVQRITGRHGDYDGCITVSFDQ